MNGRELLRADRFGCQRAAIEVAGRGITQP